MLCVMFSPKLPTPLLHNAAVLNQKTNDNSVCALGAIARVEFWKLLNDVENCVLKT